MFWWSTIHIVTTCSRSVPVVTTASWLWQQLRHTSVSWQLDRYQVELIETERLFTLGIKWSDNEWKALYRCEQHHYALRMHLRSDLITACIQQRVHTCVQSHTEGLTYMQLLLDLNINMHLRLPCVIRSHNGANKWHYEIIVVVYNICQINKEAQIVKNFL